MSDDQVTRRELLQASATLALAPSMLPLTEQATATTTAAKYVLTRLSQLGVEVLFGVPGATCDPLFAAASGPLSVVTTSSDLEAGYAADGYARVKGLGAVSVTYGVGTMSLIGVVSGAYAERVPLLVINGGPSAEDLRVLRETGSFFSHSNGREKSDLVMFREVTAAAERVERAVDVPRVVDDLLRTALTRHRPVYLEVPKHLWEAPCPAPVGALDTTVAATGHEDAVASDLLARLSAAKRPVVLLGIELQRAGLGARTAALLEKLQLPWSTTLLAKSVLDEQTPGFVGVYSGDHALPEVRQAIDGADVVLALGCVLGRQYRGLATSQPDRLLAVANDVAKLGRAPAVPVTLGPLLEALTAKPWAPRPRASPLAGLTFEQRRSSVRLNAPSTEEGLTYDEVMSAVSDGLDPSLVAITDTSLSMYPAAELTVGKGGFVCNAVWQAIGFSVGAAVGVAHVAGRRPVAICGDGGFQMTAQSLSTLAARKLPAIVIVLDNALYGIEQWLLDPRAFDGTATRPRPYLSLNRWDYAAFARAVGVSAAVTVKTPTAFREAFAAAKASQAPAFICATLKPHDLPAQLRKA